MGVVYGPVPSWRLGRSLGVDAVSSVGKTCSFDCTYCQLGRTVHPMTERRLFVEPVALRRDLAQVGSVALSALGPLMAGTPASELDPSTTRCGSGRVSLRFVELALTGQREVEFQCLDIGEVTDGAGLPSGGTVVAVNRRNGQRRCARISPTGRFGLAVPADAGDPLELQLYDKPDAVDSYHPHRGCNLLDDARRIALINTWGKGPIEPGTTDQSGGSVCEADDGCSRFGNQYFPAGATLTAVVSGLGLRRQTPALDAGSV